MMTNGYQWTAVVCVKDWVGDYVILYIILLRYHYLPSGSVSPFLVMFTYSIKMFGNTCFDDGNNRFDVVEH